VHRPGSRGWLILLCFLGAACSPADLATRDGLPAVRADQATPTLAAVAVLIPIPPTPPVTPSPPTDLPPYPAQPAAEPEFAATLPPSVEDDQPAQAIAPAPEPSPTPTPCSQPGQVVTGSFTSPLNGGQMDYRVYLPPCYGLDGLVYPTLYMFHGNATDDGHWDALGLDEAAEEAITGGLIPPLILVLPDGNPLALTTSGGPHSFEGAVMDELIPYIEANYCSWPSAEGRAVGGLSRGGYWALEIAFRHPQAFASVGGHSAALVDSFAGPDLNPQVTALSQELGDLRIYLDMGRGDWYLANVERLHLDMEAAGIPHTWVLNEGRHEDAYWADRVGDYLLWYAQAWPGDRDAYPPCDR
jgi:enterochelin esterase-like enzyme